MYETKHWSTWDGKLKELKEQYVETGLHSGENTRLENRNFTVNQVTRHGLPRPQHKALLSLSLFPTMPLNTDFSEILSAQPRIAPPHTQQPSADPLILTLGTTVWQAWQLSSCLHRSYKVWLLPLTRHHWPSTCILTSWRNIPLATCLETTRKISFFFVIFPLEIFCPQTQLISIDLLGNKRMCLYCIFKKKPSEVVLQVKWFIWMTRNNLLYSSDSEVLPKNLTIMKINYNDNIVREGDGPE